MSREAADDDPRDPRRGDLGELARLFLKLGFIGFGGPAAHIAMTRDEVVRKRAWIDDREFLDLVGATNLIPGPNSTELAIHIGARREGIRGLIVAGSCFILPAVAIVAVIAWLYERYETDPAVLDVRYGVLPVVVAIVAHALVGLGRTALTSVLPALLAVAAFIAYRAEVHELAVLVAAGLVSAFAAVRPGRRSLHAIGALLAPAGAGVTQTDVSLTRLFLVFLEIGSILYGSGYVLLAYLQSNFVERRGWLTTDQLLDAITVGQITPGPVFSTATFVGWQIDGVAGAALATLGIFLPSFVFVALLGRIVPWMQRNPWARPFLTGVVAASLGLMAAVLVDLADTGLTDAVTVVVALVALAVLLRWSINSAWLVLAGLVVGVVHAIAT